MIYDAKDIVLKGGKKCVFRSPVAEDAEGMMEYLRTCAAETNFILRYPEECTETQEQEAKYLAGINESENGVMIVCLIDGEIVGNCQISFNRRLKTKHRASVAIAIISKCWNLGIGTAMFKEMIDIARNKGIFQMELDFVEGNTRAQALYEKMGFEIVARRPDAICLKDGTMLDEFSMVKKL